MLLRRTLSQCNVCLTAGGRRHTCATRMNGAARQLLCAARLRESIFIERYLGVPHVLIAPTQLQLHKRLKIYTFMRPPLSVALVSVQCILEIHENIYIYI